MRILIQPSKEKTLIPVNKVLEIVSTDLNTSEELYIINQNETPIIKFSDTNEVFLIDNLLNKLQRIDSEIELKITLEDLISLSSTSSTNNLTVNLTKNEVNNLKNTNSLIPGLNYTITDADVNLYGGTEITLTAIASNELSLQGNGKFYCPKYDVSAEGTGYGVWTKQMEGAFSDIVGTFTLNEVVTANNGATATYLAEEFLEWISGDWSGATSISGATATANVSGFVSPSYSIGQVAHWGGKSWTNVNGNIGESIDKYTLDVEWTEIPFNETDYNVYIDEIHYDFDNDMIIYRKDRYNNVVRGSHQVFVEFESPNGYGYGNPIKDFQWGCMQDDFNTNDYFNLGIQCNEVIDSYFETLNTKSRYIWFNKLSQKSYFYNSTLSSSSFILNNTLSGDSFIRDNTLSSSSFILNNILRSNSSILNNTLSSGQLVFSNEIISKTVSDLEIIHGSVSIPNTATIIFNPSLSKTIFRRLDGAPRLQYVNNSNAVVITDVNA